MDNNKKNIINIKKIRSLIIENGTKIIFSDLFNEIKKISILIGNEDFSKDINNIINNTINTYNTKMKIKHSDVGGGSKNLIALCEYIISINGDMSLYDTKKMNRTQGSYYFVHD